MLVSRDICVSYVLIHIHVHQNTLIHCKLTYNTIENSITVFLFFFVFLKVHVLRLIQEQLCARAQYLEQKSTLC